MKWGVRKEYEPKGRRKAQQKSGNRKPTLLSGVTKVKNSENGDSRVLINDKDYVDYQKQLLAEYYGRTPAKYASESEAIYKFKNLPKFNQRLGEDQQRNAVNHNAPDYKRKINCFECSMAYEMRRRGYNVQANEVSGGFPFEVFHAFDVKDSFNIKVSSPSGARLDSKSLAAEAYKQMEEQCLSYGEGARGYLAISYAEPYDGGHAMNWVVENGRFKIVDNQSNAVEGYETFLYAKADINIYRLDNAEALPGVTDFVEEFKATDKERKEAQARYKRQQKIWKKENKKVGKNAVEKVISNIGKNVSEFVSKGMEVVGKFLRNPLNIQQKEPKSSSETSNVYFNKRR